LFTIKEKFMLELKLEECQKIVGGDCMGAITFGGAVLGGAIGGAAGFFGGFGFGAGPGLVGGSAIGSGVGAIGGAYFCYP
jgi:hypothetical protein